jgi:hypothetical protein
MVDDPFALDDVAGGAAQLSTLPAALNDRLARRVTLGENPLAAAAELTRRGDPRGLRALVGAAAFAAPEDLAALALAGDAGAESLAVVSLAQWLPTASRDASVDALARASLTPATFAALAELVDGPKKPPWSRASAVLADMTPRAVGTVRDEAAKLRSIARQMREGARGVIHRQECQRKVASGALHPVAAMLIGDDGAFLAGLLPPIADAAREGLVAPLVTLLRAPSDERRTQVLGFLQRRWKELAAPALSCVARTALKHKESGATLAATRALSAMGALDELAAVVASTAGPVQLLARTELTRALQKPVTEYDRALVDAALLRPAR